MKITDEQIEAALRSAPAPQPPSDLRTAIVSGIQRATASPAYEKARPAAGNWLRRWWPALAPGAVSLACAAALTLQQFEIREVKNTLATLASAAPDGQVIGATSQANPVQSIVGTETNQLDDLARLRADAERLRAEISQLEKLQGENTQMRDRLKVSDSSFTSEETAAMDEARERAASIMCVNNLKQFGLAVRVWSLDNNDKYPPNIVCMSNELSTPKILVCPSDTNRTAAANFLNFSTANCSYEYFGADASDTEPTRVLSRCPIHGNIGLCDGSVQRSIAKTHPERIVQRDGKLYFTP
jgi:hypothetical protein